MSTRKPLSIFLLTDIPVWTRPLERALGARGATIRVGSDLASAEGMDGVVNRLSSQLIRIGDRELDRLLDSLRQWESAGRPVINPARCLEIGLSKRRQHELFQACGVLTLETEPATPGGRAFPERDAFLKPPAGGFGKGVRRLAPGEPAPGDLDPASGWIEQVAIDPADGMVRRIEIVGVRILYEAVTPLAPDRFDYCLAKADETTALAPSDAIDPAIKQQALAIAGRAGMQLGALEYFLVEGGAPCFFDFNPVSSLHPKARERVGVDPIEVAADHILRAVDAATGRRERG